MAEKSFWEGRKKLQNNSAHSFYIVFVCSADRSTVAALNLNNVSRSK